MSCKYLAILLNAPWYQINLFLKLNTKMTYNNQLGQEHRENVSQVVCNKINSLWLHINKC